MTIEKQLRAIRKLAVKFHDFDPEHFRAVIQEIDEVFNNALSDNTACLELEQPDVLLLKDVS